MKTCEDCAFWDDERKTDKGYFMGVYVETESGGFCFAKSKVEQRSRYDKACMCFRPKEEDK